MTGVPSGASSGRTRIRRNHQMGERSPAAGSRPANHDPGNLARDVAPGLYAWVLPAGTAGWEPGAMRHVPEPDRDDWIARMRERARLDAEELVPRPGFGVFGLAEPKLRPAALAETSQVNGEWDSISLAYGDWEGADAPRVTVTTAARRASESAREAEAELLWALAQERNRIAAHADIDEDDPDEPPEYSRTEQSLGAERVAGLLGRQGNVWAARVEAHGRIVTIVGRGLEPASVRLEPVTDLAPYLQGRNQVLGRLVERQRLQPAPVLQPAEGVAAYRALAESELASQARLVE